MSTAQTCEPYRESIVALRDGRFDMIDQDQMRAAESHLNDCAACQALVAGAVAQPEPTLREAIELPTEQAWNAAWDTVDGASSSRTATPHRILRFARPWGTFAAAAVVMLMVGLWRVLPASDSDDWAFQLAGINEVEIEWLEVSDDSMSMIMSAGDDDEISIIWVIDDEGA